MGQVQEIVYLARRLYHIIVVDGWGVLLRKLRRRFYPSAYRPFRQMPGPRRKAAFPLRPFPRVTAPVVSIVVGVTDGPRWGSRWARGCLEALRAHESKYSFEVIIAADPAGHAAASGSWFAPGARVLAHRDNSGWGAGLNSSRSVGNGDFLVFLQGDALIGIGWLDALIDTFGKHPAAGIVGSRVLRRDGRLLHAGGVVLADGSACDYGFLHDPYRPEFCYLRETDYVSAASFGIRRAVFDAIGGFDEGFVAAGYDTVDIAFRVRSAGYTVLYQPASVIVCTGKLKPVVGEPVTARERHSHAACQRACGGRRGLSLTTRGARPPDLERYQGRRGQRRAFIADTYMVTPDRDSGSLRMWGIMQILQELGFKVTFAASNLEALEPYVTDLQQSGIEVLYRPFERSVRRHLHAQGRWYDLVVLSRADTAAAFLGSARRYCPSARIVYDTVDLHHLREMRLARLTGDSLALMMAERRRQQELRLIAQANTTLVVSTLEQQLLRRELPEADVRVLSNIHRIVGSRRSFAERRDIMFIGAFAHPPNADAVSWFCREVFPLVQEREPDIQFFVIGAEPPREVRALSGGPIQILGHVSDASFFFDSCRLSVAPLRYGAGVKGKVNQSLAYGLPVIATSHAIEGMFLEQGLSVLSADEPRAFADQLVRGYRDQVLWERLSAGGLAVMEAHFSYAAARRALIKLITP